MTGTGTLTGLVLRRDRLLIAVWAVLPCVVPAVFVAAFRTGFPTAAALQEYADTSVHTTAFAVTYGVLRGSSLGELVSWRAGFLPVMVGLFCLLTVVRHTRREEEQGRRELIGATAVGRHAGLAAALVVTCGAALLLGVLSALVLVGTGLPAAGSWAFGLGLAATGWTFAAIGAVVAQLTTGTGAARGIGIVVLGAAFLVRGVGDVSAQSGGSLGWVSWLSPIAWSGLIRPFSGERWWVLAVAVGASVVLTAVAAALASRRDLGVGLLHTRPGPAGAAPGLRTPPALAWRLQRGAVYGRTVGFAVVGFVLGAMATSVASLLTTAAAGGGGEVVGRFFVGMVTVLGLAAAVFAIQCTLRLQAEETSGRAEAVLAGPVDRVRWAAGHVGVALVGPVIWMTTAGVALGAGYGATTGDLAELPRLLGAALVQLPAVWVFAALAFALFGTVARFAAAAFAVLAVSLVCGLLGGEIPAVGWVSALSVFGQLPQLPGGDLRILPLAALTVAALALVAVGAAGLRRRDMR